MEVKTVNDVVVVSLMRRFDAYTAGEAELKITKIIEEGTKKLVCDFSQTEYLASAGLRVLITACKRLQKNGGQLVLCSIKPYVLEVFDISGLNRIFKMYDSLEIALQNLN
ncbi:MAG: STAS domain-containing protein [Crenarchaeota archaeon]|nr:STAS domain-containing protein [Thermoproteota archaeon]